MTKQNLSGCLSDKQILVLNNKFNELPFELGCVLDEVFFKLASTVTAQEFCDHADTPQDTAGEDVFVCINDGNCLFVPKADVIAALETTTQAQYDATTHTITYIDEDGNPTDITLNCGLATIDPATCELVYTDEKGTETRTAIPQPNLSIDTVANELIWTDAKGVEERFPLGGVIDCITSPNAAHTVCVDDDGCLVVSELNNATPLDNTTAEGFLAYDDQGRIKPMALADTIDIKCITLCDVGNNNEPYILEVTHNITQGTKTTATYELDGTTAYTVIEAGQYKPKDYETQKVWIVDGTSAPNEATEQYWEASAIDTGNGGDNAAISESFTLLDGCGLPLHENAPDVTNILTVDGTPTTENTAVNVSHQNQVDLFLCIPRGGATVTLDVVGDTNVEFYSGKCGSKLALEYASPNPASAAALDYSRYFTEGIYQIRYYNDDVSQNGRAQLRWDVGGGNSLIPIENIFSSVPTIENDLVKVCTETGEIQRLDGTALLPTDKVYYCDPCADFVASDSDPANKEFELVKAWVGNNSGIANEATEQYWVDGDAVDLGIGNGGSTGDIALTFSDVDGCGLPQHPNNPTSVNALIVDGVITTDTTVIGQIENNQVDFFLHVPKGGALVRYNTTGTSDYALAFARCGNKAEIVGQITGSSDFQLGFLSAGYYQVRFYVADPGQNGRGEIQWKPAGLGNFTDVPIGNIYKDQPGADACYLRLCKEDGAYQNLDGSDLDPAVHVFACNPCAD